MRDGNKGGPSYIDAHLHLQDVFRKGLEPSESRSEAISLQLTNGTHPDDWSAVQNISGDCHTRILKAYGVHPWKVDNLPEDWQERLRSLLSGDAVSVGEIGLDHWIEVKDERHQTEVFETQLEMAAEFKLPPTLHCLKAWGLLIDCLSNGPDFEKGFLVHGFGGSKEVLYQLADMGGYFSFSSYAADPKRKRMRDAIRACPQDRLLAETDAPDMVPPKETCRYPFSSGEEERLHHPLEIETAYAFIADIRKADPTDLAGQIRENFARLFDIS